MSAPASKRLLEFYRGMPGELRTFALLLGVLVPTMTTAGLFWFMNSGLGLSKVETVLALLGLLVLITLVVFGVNFIARWRETRRAGKLGREMLETPASRQTSVSEREAIKQNNNKFVTAVADMKKTWGISAYSLPWYIVIGESGCGKTRLINESNLEFPSGKPEGHNVGTLNYNWWFTQDMVFLDMAGRLVNPAEEKDHQEWLGFLRSVRKARPACPVNGALVCMSADDDLLSASPEKLRANAENMLIRLRELQRELGVTFPVYLVVTKCDKLLGFMEFFGRVTGKLALSTQMVGWSRPGEDFSAAFDPETFKANFNEVYERLHEFRLRRLRDDIDESARAAAYCFPEELAQLREPLNAYVSTLFPLLKNQLVLKNLVFRGVYFTSATQQGGAVLGHLRSRLGEDAARALERLAPLFTQPEPRFVKELLQKKVEPEHGLVYRNEGQLKRNRTAARWLNIATAALVVLGGLGWWWSYSAFKKVVQQPREDAKASHQSMVAAADFAPATALARTAALSRDADQLRQHGLWLARVLSMGTQTEKPLTWLGEIRAGIVRDKLLPVAAQRVIAGINTYPLDDLNRQNQYLDALASLLAWRRSAGAPCVTDCVTVDGLRQMAAIAPAPGSDAAAVTAGNLWDWKVSSSGQVAASQPAGAAAPADIASFSAELQQHFSALEGNRQAAPNPARAFGGDDVTAALRTGVKRLAEQRLRWAKLEPAPPGTTAVDAEFDALLALARDCASADHAYQAFLTAATPRQAPGNSAEFETLASSVQKNANEFVAALDRCARPEAPRVELLWDKLRAYRNRYWFDAHQKLLNVSCSACDGSGARLSQPATPRDLIELDQTLWNTLVNMRLAEGALPESGFDSAAAPPQFRPLADAFAHIVRVQREPVPGNVQLTDVAREMQRTVQQIAAELAPGAGNVRTLTDWADRLRAHRSAAAAATALSDALRKTPAWQPDRLVRVREDLTPLVHRARGGALLTNLAGLLDRLSKSDPLAVAAWQTPRWRDPVALAYALPTPAPLDDLFPTSAPTPGAPVGDAPAVSIGDRSPAGGGARTQTGPYALTRAGLMETAIAAAMLQNALSGLQATDYLTTEGATPDALSTRVGALWDRYSEAYVTAWAKAIQARPVSAAPAPVWDDIVRIADGRTAERWSVETADFVENVACSAVYVERDGAWLDSVRVHSSTAETRALDAALQQAMRRGFPGLQRPSLGREGGLPWEREATTVGDAWRDLRADVQMADATLAGRAPARPDANRFARFAEAESTFTWPDLPALQDARNFERAACTALGLEMKRKLESTGGALSNLTLDQRCARWRELKDELNSFRALLGGCGKDTLTWSPPDLEACCQPSVSQDVQRLELTFELMTDGELAQMPNVRPGDNSVASCFRKVRLLVGASEAILDTATGGDRRKVIALTQASGFTLSFETPVGQEQVEPVAPRAENFGSWGELINYLLQKGQRTGDGVYVTVHPFETRSKSGGKIQTFKQAIRWTVRGKVANMSVTDYLQKCGS